MLISSLTPKPPEVLAAELVLLEERRPAKPMPGTDTWLEDFDRYKDHMGEEWSITQAIYTRIGLDRGIELIKQAHETAKLFTPGNVK